MSKKLLTAILLGVLAVAVIIALILTLPTVLNKQALTKNVTSTTIPTFSNKVPVIAGWRVDVAAPTAHSYANLTKTTVVTLQPNGTVAKNAASKFCQVLVQTSFLPAYQAGEGDFYLSKAFVYTQAQNAQVTLKNEKTTWLKSNAGDLEFVTGAYNTRLSTAVAKDGKTTTSTPVSVLVAARAIDKLYANGAPVAPNGQQVHGLYGSDAYKGVPVLTATYTCYNKTPSTTEFNKILRALNAKI